MSVGQSVCLSVCMSVLLHILSSQAADWSLKNINELSWSTLSVNLKPWLSHCPLSTGGWNQTSWMFLSLSPSHSSSQSGASWFHTASGWRDPVIWEAREIPRREQRWRLLRWEERWRPPRPVSPARRLEWGEVRTEVEQPGSQLESPVTWGEGRGTRGLAVGVVRVVGGGQVGGHLRLVVVVVGSGQGLVLALRAQVGLVQSLVRHCQTCQTLE